MTIKLVFPEPEHPRLSPLGNTEPGANWYLQSTRDEARLARQAVNSSYARFPDKGDALLDKLRSPNEIFHTQALDELGVHELINRNVVAKYEERLGSPDFSIYRDGTYVCGIEVASILLRDDWAAEQYKHGRIADKLNAELLLDRWFLSFEIVSWPSNREPPLGRLVDWVRTELARLPTDLAIDPQHYTPPEATYRSKGVELRFQFFPRKTDAPERPDGRIVGTGPMIGGFVDSKVRLRDRLRKKGGSRYDLQGAPFAIFIGLQDPFCTLDQIIDALYGTEQIVVPIGPRPISDESITFRRASDGFFGLSKERPEGKNRRVSAIFAGRFAWHRPESLRSNAIRFDNPFASTPFPSDIISVEHTFSKVDHGSNSSSMEWMPNTPLQDGTRPFS
ncbi:hypothetical protein E1295_33185 [Nonomuraea mesophila]|uniref:Uncharacterized protein n=1 Tax=Nonomuraea mesophila TaxID=2530382 RepID=A0A4R5EVB0_9ACTN|nr:hypothetical protein [Nonomuraea mesophila]TDE38811.1 hypothetical protein E1295_33185 [Nonomuraea mesophila]